MSGGTRLRNTASTALSISLLTISTSRSSSRVSISTLPDVEAPRASRSVARGTTWAPPDRRVRRAALATRVSKLEMLSRTDTPERWETWGLERAAWVSSATISVMNEGTVTGRPSTDAGRASWWTMAISVSTSRG